MKAYRHGTEGRPVRRFAAAVARAFALFRTAAVMQVWSLRADAACAVPLVAMPALSLASFAILVEGGRPDLAGHAVTASVLMTIGQMSFFVAGDIVSDERRWQTLEMVLMTDAGYFTILFARTVVLAACGVLGFFEAWAIGRLIFGLDMRVFHPGVLVTALAGTVLAAATTAVTVSSLLSLVRNNRTIQTSLGGPLYLLSGVLVPVEHLGDSVRHVTPLIFLYWSGDMVRTAFSPEPAAWAGPLSAVLLLGVAAAVLGGFAIGRITDELRRTGAVGLS